MIDLLGSDVPSDSSSAFKWADGVLIKAMKEGAWLLLDELNMASQTVLEGLNSILDHRGSIYLPELDKTVEKATGFRIFASQNPTSMGSGRKGLPHSFLTRFTRIWLEAYTETELKQIIYDLYPETKTVSVLRKLLRFFFSLKEHFSKQDTRHGDVLWEFNLRDLHLMFDHLNTENGQNEPTLDQVSETLVSTLLFRLPRKYHKFFHNLYQQIFRSPLVYTLKNRLDTENETKFPFSLNLSSLKNLLPIVQNPLTNAVNSLLRTTYPIMFICNRTTEGLFNVQEFLESYASNSTDVQFVTMNLFESSDVVDLIGGFEMKAANEQQETTLFTLKEEATEGAMATEAGV